MSQCLGAFSLRVAWLSFAVALSSCGSDRFVVALIEQGGSAGQADQVSGGLSATAATINGAGGRAASAAETTAPGQRTTHPANGGAPTETSLGGTNNVVGVSSATVAGTDNAVGGSSGKLVPAAGETAQAGQGARASTSEGGRTSLGGASGTDTFVLAWAAGAGSTGFDGSCGCIANSTSQSCFIDVQTGQQTCTIPCTPISDCSDGCPCADVEVVWDRLSESTDIECVTSDGCGTGGFCSIIFTRGSPYRLESSACVSSGIVTL